VLLLAGAILRVFVLPGILVKVRMVYPLVESALTLETIPRYGPTAPVLYHLLFHLMPGDTWTITAAHSLIGSLTLLLIVAFARAWLPAPNASWLLALFVALTPVFLRDSNSESIMVPGLFFLMAGLVLLQEFLEFRRLPPLLASVPFLALAIYLRPEMLIMTMLFVLVLVAPAVFRKEALPYLLGLVGGLLLLALPFLLFQRDTVAVEVARGNVSLTSSGYLDMLVTKAWRQGMILIFAPRAFPVVLTALALIGLGLGASRRESRYATLSLFLIALFWFAVYYVDFNEESMLRLHVPPAILITILAAYGLAQLVARMPSGPMRIALLAGTVAACVASAVPGARKVFFESNSHVDDRVFREVITALPDMAVDLGRRGAPDLPLGALSPQDNEAPQTRGTAPVHLYYPDYLLLPPSRQDRILSISEWAELSVDERQRTFFYLSTQCYAYRSDDWPDDWDVEPDPFRKLHPACRWLLARHHVVPVKLRVEPNLSEYAAPFQWYPDELETMTLGLFEVSGPRQGEPPRDSFAGIAKHYFGQAKDLIEEDRFAEAETILVEANRLTGGNSPFALEQLAGFYFYMGVQQDSLKRLEESMTLYRQVADLDITHPFLLSRIGGVYNRLSKHMDPDQTREFLAGIEDTVVGKFLLGMNYFYVDADYLKSIHYMEQVRKVVEQDPRVYVYLSLDHFYLGHQELAEQLAEKAVEVGREVDPDAYYVRSIVVRRTDLDQAVRDIEIYLKLSEGKGKVKKPEKEAWLRQELEKLKRGEPSSWWTSKEPEEPWSAAQKAKKQKQKKK